MNISLSFLLFSFIILLYWVITELFTFFFRFTGLPDERARFQVLSLLTGTGFTTRESELILGSRRRRRLARITMLFGYVFNPRTGEQIKIDAARVPAFKPGKAMKDAVSKKK